MAMQATAAKSSRVWRVMVSSVESAPEHLQQQSRGWVVPRGGNQRMMKMSESWRAFFWMNRKASLAQYF